MIRETRFAHRCIYHCRILVVQGWWHTSMQAPWRAERPGEPATDGSAIAAVPGLDATAGPPDQMHTWHLGVGQYLAGGLVVPR